MDSDKTRSFVTDIAFSIYWLILPTSAQRKKEERKVVGGGKVLCIVGDAELSLAPLQFNPICRFRRHFC